MGNKLIDEGQVPDMHELEGNYRDKDGDCSVKIEGGEPYLLLNLELFQKLTDRFKGPHCDFIYVISKEDRFIVFIVELKNIKYIESLEEELLDKTFQKFQNTTLIAKQLLSETFNVRAADYRAILALSPNCLESLKRKTKALLAHFKGKFRKLKTHGLTHSWITACNCSIWNRIIELF